jgi:hypothetical protein
MLPEPKHIGAADSKKIEGPYKKYSQPLISPDKKHKYRNVAAGAMKVLKIGDSLVGFNNGIYKGVEGRNQSCILLLHSENGLKWDNVFEKPIIYPTRGWKMAFVYQLDVRPVGDTYWLYYNARNNWIRASEKIGLAILQKNI